MERSEAEAFIKLLETDRDLRTQMHRVLDGKPAVQGKYNFTNDDGVIYRTGLGNIATIYRDRNPDVDKVYPGDVITLNGNEEVVAAYEHRGRGSISFLLKS